MAFIEIDRLERIINGSRILNGVDLRLEQGGFLALLGPSGCGKTTLLQVIAGLQAPTAGDIRIDGRSVLPLPPARRDIAMVFQSQALYPTMTVAENIGFPLEMAGWPRRQRRAEVIATARKLQIEDLLDRRPAALSGGQRQRVAMARAMVRKPRLFLFDEPLSGLDARLRLEIRAQIRTLHETTGTTIIHVTHDQSEAMAMATRIAVMKDGAIQQIGTPQAVYDRPDTVFVADFIGTPPMNLLRGVVAGDGRTLRPEVDPGLRIPLPGPLAPGRPVTFGVRAEAIGLTGDGAIDLPVIGIEPTGADHHLRLRIGSGEIVLRMTAMTAIRVGDILPVRIDPARAVVFDGTTGRRIDAA